MGVNFGEVTQGTLKVLLRLQQKGYPIHDARFWALVGYLMDARFTDEGVTPECVKEILDGGKVNPS